MSEIPGFWTTGYLADGRKVSYTITAGMDVETMQTLIRQSLWFASELVTAGVSVNAPGLEAGEQKDTITAVARRVKFNKDGTESPLIDLYNENFKFSHIKVYLDTPDEIAAFETATGVRLDSLPVFDGDNAVDRESPKAARYIRQLPRPVEIAYRDNPLYTEGSKKYPKRLFDRWLGVDTSTPPAQPRPAASQPAVAPADPVEVIVTHITVNNKKSDYTLTAIAPEGGELEVRTWGHDLFRAWGIEQAKWEAWDARGSAYCAPNRPDVYHFRAASHGQKRQRVLAKRNHTGGKTIMMLRTNNIAGTFIYPQLKSPTTTDSHDRRNMLSVFVPSGDITGNLWACTIEGTVGEGAIVLETTEDVARLITALEIAYEKIKTRDGVK